ncbi:MAG: FecR domain-containing protein [Leptospiraceae bacterium]|nr:FecR domain-containing protein [Leptospiraceae bacterium]
MKHILFILCTIFLFVLNTNCKDKKKEVTHLQAGVVTFNKGDNKLVSKEGKEQKIQREMFFFKEDTIRTGKDGIVDIQIVDGVIIRIKQNSELKLSEILIEDNGNIIKTKLDLKSGKVFTKTTKKLNGESSFVIATPTFVAGVRGTEFIVEESGGKEQTLVSDGAVNIEKLDENGKPTGKEMVIEKGKKGLIEKDSVQSQDLSPDELAELKEDSQTISSLTEDAKNRIQEIIRGVDDQKQINRETLEEQMLKNSTELNDLKDKNEQLLNEQKEKNQQLINETTDKTNLDKTQIQDTTKAATEEVKNKATNELDEMRNKNKIDKSQFAPK